MMTLLNSLALLLLLARVKCTPVILPETHLTPTESAQAANFTTELAFFLRSRVAELLNDTYRQKSKKARILRWIDQRGGMGNQLQSLAGAVIVAAATGRRLSVVPRNEASVAAWLWGDGGFFEDPLRGWRRQTLRSSSRITHRMSASPKDKLERLKGQQQQRRIRRLTEDQTDNSNNASPGKNATRNVLSVPPNTPGGDIPRPPPLPYPMPSKIELSKAQEKLYRQQRVKQQQRQRAKRDQRWGEQNQRQQEQRNRRQIHHDQQHQHLRQYPEVRQRRRRRLDTGSSSSSGMWSMTEVLKAYRYGDLPNVVTQASMLTVQAHHLDLTNALRKDPKVHQWLFTALAQPDARRAAASAAAAATSVARNPSVATSKSDPTAAAAAAERAAVDSVLRRFPFSKVSQLPQLEWPVAHALGALDWSPKPPLEEAATWESRRWSPYEAESARALQVRTCVDCGWIMSEAQVKQTAVCDMALLTQTMQPSIRGELPSVLLPENFLDQASLQNAQEVKSEHYLQGSSGYEADESKTNAHNVQIGVRTRFPRPQEGYTQAQQQRRLLSSGRSIYDSNENNNGSSSHYEQSPLAQWLSSLATKVLHRSVLSDVFRWTISSSGHVPASVQIRPTEKEDVILKPENLYAQSAEIVRVNNGFVRSEGARDFDVTAPSRTTESRGLVFVTTDSESAGRKMATILASQYRVVSSSSLSLSPTLHAKIHFNSSAGDSQHFSSHESELTSSFKFVHASSIAADVSKSRPSMMAKGNESSETATEWHASSQDELFVARLGPVLDWWLLGEFDHVASCGTTFSLTAIGRRPVLPRSVVLHEHHRPEPLTSATTTSKRRRRISREKQSTLRPFLQRPINNSTARASDTGSFHGRSFPAQSVLSPSEPEQRRQLRGKMLVPESTQTGIQQHGDIVSSSTSAVEKEQGSANTPEASAIHPDGNIMALFPKSWSGCTSVEVLGRRWLDSRSSPLDHARENMPDEPRQADWLFNSGVYESPPLQGATSYPAAAGGAAVAGNANAAANANAAGVHADIAIGAANIATTRTHLVVPEDAHSEGIDRFRTHHELDQGQRRPSRFKPKKRRQPR